MSIARLILAPHFDDAVMSCWRAITDAGDDVQVTVATVFAGAPPTGSILSSWDAATLASSPEQAWQVRVAEDGTALAGTGATVVHLPFTDDQYRVGPAPRAALEQAIGDLIEQADEVWIPAGIGGHPDHLLVAHIALPAGRGRRYLYADLPYAAAGGGWESVVGAVRGGHHDESSLRAQLDYSASIPPLAMPVLVELTATEQAAKLQAVQAYSSQLDPLIAAFGRWFEASSIAPFELHWDVTPPSAVATHRWADRLRSDHDLLTALVHRASDNDEQARHSAAHEEGARMRQENDEALRGLQAEHQQQTDALRAHHAHELAVAVDETTRMFTSSTSWRLTAPVRSLSRLRRRLVQRRGAAPATTVADVDVSTAAPAAQAPSAGASLKAPADPGVNTWPAANFNELYEQHSDPWEYSTRWYEQRKFGITLACLPLQRYRRTFEPGCSVGVLSELLAPRTEAMISADFAAPALVHARERLARFPHVDVQLIAVPTEWPDGTFDLIVISEMATYLSDSDLDVLVARTLDSLEPDGALVLVHYRPNTGTPHTAAEVHERFRQQSRLSQFATHEEEAFILDVFQRTTAE